MNKTLLCILTLVFAAPLVAADSYSGYFLPPGNPLSLVVGGVTEAAVDCDPSSPLQGVDGYWFDIFHEPAGSSFSLTMDPTLDADVYFYDAGCGFISYFGGTRGGIGGTETGTVPAGGAWAIVDNFAGFGSFTFTIG